MLSAVDTRDASAVAAYLRSIQRQLYPLADPRFLDRVMEDVAEDLVRKAPAFWRKLVEPRLREDFLGVYRYLARPYPDGPNPYLLAVERNIAIITDMVQAPAPAGR